MAITRLNLIELQFNQSQYYDVTLKLLQRADFHPELASKFTDTVTTISNLTKENEYEEIYTRLKEIGEKYHFEYTDTKCAIQPLNLYKTKEYLNSVITRVEQINAVRVELDKMAEENNQAIIQLKHVKEMDVDFDDLFSCKYLQVRFGKLPVESIKKLSYYDTFPFVYTIFDQDKTQAWGMYITTPDHAPEVDNIFSSIHFERIFIPRFVHGQPDLAIQEVEEEANVAREESQKLQDRIAAIFENQKDELNHIYTVASHLNLVYEIQKYTIVVGNKLSIYGFTPKSKSKDLKKDFESIEGVHVEITPARHDTRLTPPTLLTNNWFVKPFRMFVEMYGSPSYSDIDPTLFVAITYTLLFGVMFGDVGQGILLSLFGYFAYKKWDMELGLVGTRLGISSALFGFVFGSIFGNEHLLPAMFHTMDPSNTMTLLIGAVALGITFIVISMLFNTVLNFRKRQYGQAWFSQNGVCGLVFYTSVLMMAMSSFLQRSIVNPITLLLGIVLPVIGMFFKEPLTRHFENEEMFPEGLGAFLMEGVFEMFEVVLSFVTNTMSFLRVGGFVLSHAGMMLVVYTLADMVGGIGSVFVLVFGNLFVMALEGLIVGIQVLRLEFYEMFSRYYEGNGRPFRSIKEERI